MPNPFYQAYGAAALAVGAEPVPVPATAETGFLPDYAALPPALLDRVTLCYLCSPANPQGAVADAGYWRGLIALAERHDFRILADECYAEIYRDTPPPGALEIAAAAGADPERVVVFNSLSKRSNAPGLRSGFAAGGPRSIAAMRQLRAYGGAPLPLPIQRASTALWQDEAHVERQPRALRREVRPRRPHARRHARLRRAGRAASSSGSTSATARPRRSGSGARPACASCPAATSAAPPPTRRTPATDYIRVALVADAAQVERGLAAIRATLGPAISQEKVE